MLCSHKFNGSIVIDNKKFNIYCYDNENMVDIVITNGTEDDFKYVVNTVIILNIITVLIVISLNWIQWTVVQILQSIHQNNLIHKR